jgi:hypothetical protein
MLSAYAVYLCCPLILSAYGLHFDFTLTEVESISFSFRFLLPLSDAVFRCRFPLPLSTAAFRCCFPLPPFTFYFRFPLST